MQEKETAEKAPSPDSTAGGAAEVTLVRCETKDLTRMGLVDEDNNDDRAEREKAEDPDLLDSSEELRAKKMSYYLA